MSRSASRDESRPVLTGILARFEGGKLVMAATDSYRLSVKETPFTGDAPELEAIIPARALTEVTRIAAGADSLELGVHENQVVFVADGVTLTTRRIEGQFPNYRQLLPETFEHAVALPRSEALEVVRRVAVMAQRNSPLRLRFADGELTISAQTQDVGEARESMQVAFEGEPLEIGFNPDFLREGIESVTSDEVLLEADQPAPARSAAGRRRRLLVPDHADPPRRLIVRDGLAPEHPLVREARARAAAGSRARRRAERRRQDEPARVAACRDAGLLAAHADRRTARALRRACGPRRAPRAPWRDVARARGDARGRRGKRAS